MVFGPLTEEEYDLELLEAKRERLAKGVVDDIPSNDDFTPIDDDQDGVITRESIFKDLRKVSRRIDRSKSSPKPSKT